MSGDREAALIADIERLVAAGRLPLASLTSSGELLQSLGFEIHGPEVAVPALERLEEAAIRAALSGPAAAWLAELMVYPVVASTSTLLLERGAAEPIDGAVALAELQVGGRGRRGRRWQSPFGANLALSLGIWLPLAPAQIGGFSLCVGLALLDRLQSLGVAGLALKWPNDLLLDGRKLAGILIDVLTREEGVQLVVGVGLNVALPAAALEQIDQPVSDLRGAGVQVSRNRLAAACISGIVEYADAFRLGGFEPMRAQFDAHHAYHGRECRVLRGSTATDGIVRGVGVDGELLLETARGLEAFGAGEVSLRV